MLGLLGGDNLISAPAETQVEWGDLRGHSSSTWGRLISISPWPSAVPARWLVNTCGVDSSFLKCPWDEASQTTAPHNVLAWRLESVSGDTVAKQHIFIYSLPVLEVRNPEWVSLGYSQDVGCIPPAGSRGRIRFLSLEESGVKFYLGSASGRPP